MKGTLYTTTGRQCARRTVYADIHGVDVDRIRDKATSSQQKRRRWRSVVVFFAHAAGFGFFVPPNDVYEQDRIKRECDRGGSPETPLEYQNIL